jgi:hypothetical protein
LKSLPAELDTKIGPVLAPAGITPVTVVASITFTEVKFLRPIFMTSTPVMPVPVTVTVVPTGPDDGDMPVMNGPIIGLIVTPFDIATAICVGVVDTGAVVSATKK